MPVTKDTKGPKVERGALTARFRGSVDYATQGGFLVGHSNDIVRDAAMVLQEPNANRGSEWSVTLTDRGTTRIPFSVDAALLVELGERLVGRRSVAVAELIKNAYDADATKVTVSFENVTRIDGRIVVRDDGTGISLEVMERTWMRVATTDAAVNALSKRFGRQKTGAKGVGRFACGRLASLLSLESVSHTSRGGLERIRATFDLREFKPGRDLEDVPIEIVQEYVDDAVGTGTTLCLHHLIDAWTEHDMSELQAELDVLQQPGIAVGVVQRSPEYEPDPGFEIDIRVPEFRKYEGKLDERFLGAAWGTLDGRITDQNTPSYTLTVRKTRMAQTFRPSTCLYKHLADASFTIHMMVYQGSGFRAFGYRLADARKIGRRAGGVRVYLDRFRVFSYGAPGDDWLDLDQDRARRLVALPDQLKPEAGGLKRPMLLLPGNMQLFGAVAISRNRNPGLAVSISRERLVQNEGFDELKRFVRDGIDWMTVCYARELAKSPSDGSAPSPAPRRPIDAVRSARDLVREAPGVETDVKEAIQSSLREAETLLTREGAARMSELSMLRVLASAGTTVLVFDHTLRAMAGQLEDIVEKLGIEVSYLPADRRGMSEQLLDDLRSWSSIATGQGSLVGLLVGSEARTRRASLAVRPLVETLSRGFSGYMSRFGIDLENAVSAVVRTPPLHEAELYAVLLNLLTNSFKAVRERTDRRVRVEADVTPRCFTLRVHDTGVGVPSGSREEVFEPFYTTSQPDPVLGIGTGLGLKIVRDIAIAWGGSTKFVDPSDPWRASIELTVPIRR